VTARQSDGPTPPIASSPDRSAAPPGPAVRLITVSAAYGAGGSVVAPALADRLGLPFLQRVTTSEGHIAEPGPCDEQLSAEEVKVTPVHRLLAHFTQAMPAGPTQSPPSTHHQDEHLRGRGEAGIQRLLAGGSARTAAFTSGWTARPSAASSKEPRLKASVRSGRGSAYVRPTRPVPPTSAAYTGATRLTRPCTTW